MDDDIAIIMHPVILFQMSKISIPTVEYLRILVLKIFLAIMCILVYDVQNGSMPCTSL